MSNDIDTDAIRAEVEQWGEALAGDWTWELCDALDAARAELGKHKSLAELSHVSAEISNARAEAAEAGAARWEHDYWRELARAEAAEARIAAALAALPDNTGPVYRALTGGTP